LLLQAIKEAEAKAKKEAAAMMRKVCIVMYHKLMCMVDIFRISTSVYSHRTTASSFL
jgi:hypothetical protein